MMSNWQTKCVLDNSQIVSVVNWHVEQIGLQKATAAELGLSQAPKALTAEAIKSLIDSPIDVPRVLKPDTLKLLYPGCYQWLAVLPIDKKVQAAVQYINNFKAAKVKMMERAAEGSLETVVDNEEETDQLFGTQIMEDPDDEYESASGLSYTRREDLEWALKMAMSM